MNAKLSMYVALAAFVVIVLIKSILSSIGLLMKIGMICLLIYPIWKTYKAIKGAIAPKKRIADYSIDKSKLSTLDIDKKPKDWL